MVADAAPHQGLSNRHEDCLEARMLKTAIGIIGVLIVTNSTLAHAQGKTEGQGVQMSERLSPSDLKAITDARIAIVKAALQLTPEQERYWPAIEQAVRARAEARQKRVAALEALSNQQGEVDPFKVLKDRADALAQKAATLNKLVDAWQPLYQTLNDDQKRRLGFVVTRFLPALKDAYDDRQMDAYDETDEDEQGE
jgi:DNA repair ATPase RecN